MRLNLTPQMMEAAYELLRSTPPFRGWRLPEADDIRFVVMADPSAHGHFYADPLPTIGVNQKRTLTLNALLMNTAHEMIHLRQWWDGAPQTHGTYYQEMKRAVCRHHGFDPGVF